VKKSINNHIFAALFR